MHVFANDLVKHIFDDLGGGLTGLARLNPLGTEVTALLRGEAVPNAVTSNNAKLVFGCQRNFFYFRYACDHLISDTHLFSLFVFEVAQGTGKRQDATYAALLNEATGGLDSALFARVVGLVVLRHFDRGVAAHQHTAAVSGIGANDRVFREEGYACGATLGHREGGDGVLRGLGVHHLVHLDEGLGEGLLVIAGLVLGQLFEELYKLLLDELGDFRTAVAIENAEKRFALGQLDICDVRILLLVAPALHRNSTVRVAAVRINLGLLGSVRLRKIWSHFSERYVLKVWKMLGYGVFFTLVSNYNFNSGPGINSSL